MQTYIGGTKVVDATPMTRLEYNQFRGWELPTNENGDDAGYLVEYTNGSTPNTTTYKGYVSWSPKAQFDDAYRETKTLTFGIAVESLKQGRKLARSGWNGKGMFVFLIIGGNHIVSCEPMIGIFPAGTEINVRPHIYIKNVDGSISTWVPSIGDVLADDLSVV